MPKFFTQNINDGLAYIEGDDARHIVKSLRMKPGEELLLGDGRMFDYKCKIESLEPSCIALKVLEKTKNTTELPVNITLYQGVPKGDKLEFIVQKAVELGAFKIVPVVTARCISRPDKKSAENKVARLNKIAQEAAGQSMRGILPTVAAFEKFNDVIANLPQTDLNIIFYENAKLPLKACLSNSSEIKNINIVIGPEGGFDEDEVNLAAKQGFKVLSLGGRILRCETAPLSAISQIAYHCEYISENSPFFDSL